MRVALVYRGPHLLRPAMDLETLAAVLTDAGHSVRAVYDPDTFGATDNVLQFPRLSARLAEDVPRRIAALHPDVVVFSVLPSTYRWARQAAAGTRALCDAPIVMLGLHPTLVPEHVLRDPFVDFVIQGEAEDVIVPLLEAIERGGDPAEVGNLWYRRQGQPTTTFRADRVDLDRLPVPDKDLFRPFIVYEYSYVTAVSRGCPRGCTYCEETCLGSVHGPGFFRRRSVDSVMRELNVGLRRYRFREVIFKDSYLSGDEAWLASFVDRYRREIDRPFKCFCTVQGFDDRTARLLVEGGCYCVEFGLQTWNEELRRTVLNRHETNEQARTAFEICDRHGLWYDVDHMFNLPGESVDDHRLGARHYRSLRHLNRVKVHYLCYLPTARIVEQAVQSGEAPRDLGQRLADGDAGFFFDPGVVGAERRRTVSGYASLFKLLPALPPAAVEWLAADPQRVGWLGRIPSPVMAGMQGMLALRSGDLRFSNYARFYPRKITRSLGETVSRMASGRSRADG